MRKKLRSQEIDIKPPSFVDTITNRKTLKICPRSHDEKHIIKILSKSIKKHGMSFFHKKWMFDRRIDRYTGRKTRGRRLHHDLWPVTMTIITSLSLGEVSGSQRIRVC